MNQYSHAVLAQSLLPILAPARPPEYLWGAVAPDIRYLAGLPRQATHLPDEVLASWMDKFPGWESFIQGYRVHCLLDRIDSVQAVSAKAPLRWLLPLSRRKLTLQQAAVLIELHFLRAAPSGLRLEGGHNPILEHLGLRPGQSAAFLQAQSEYIGAPSVERGIRIFGSLGLLNDQRIQKYWAAYKGLRRIPLLLDILLLSVRNAHLEEVAKSIAVQMLEPASTHQQGAH